MSEALDLSRYRIKPLGDPPPPAERTALIDLLDMVLAEAGHPQNPNRPVLANGDRPTDPLVPWAVLNKARILVLDRMGVPYRLEEFEGMTGEKETR